MVNFPKLSLFFLIVISAVSLNGCGDLNQNLNSTDKNKNIAEETIRDSRLDLVKQRGKLICGVNGQLPGFSVVDDNGTYSGMDVDFCRAIAAVLFDDPNLVEYISLNAAERFTAVSSGKVDLLSRNTTWTLSRDTSVGMDFAPTTFYDGQGLLVGAESEIDILEDLDSKSVCLLAGTTHQENLEDRLRKKGLSYSPVIFEDANSLYNAYEQGECEVATSDRSQLTSRRTLLNAPQEHLVLPEILSKEPLGPLVANGDSQWLDVVKWTIYASIQGEDLGISSQNISRLQGTKNPEIRRFLNIDAELANNLGLPQDFARRAIEHVGNYGEIYERNIGKPYGLARGLNALWKDGGLMYAPPFR